MWGMFAGQVFRGMGFMANKTLATVVLILSCSLAFCLIGCGGSSSTSSAGNDSSGVIVNSVSGISDSASDVKDKAIAVTLGDGFSTDGCDMVFSDAYWAEIDERGNVAVSVDENTPATVNVPEGNVPFILRVDVTNKLTDALSLEKTFYGEAIINGEYTYKVRAYPQDWDWDIQPLDTETVSFLLLLPEAAKDQFEIGEIKIGVDPNRKSQANSLDGFDLVYSFTFA